MKTYTRRGLTAPSTFGDIDILSYTYGDAQRPDRLTKITDTGDANKGFKHNPPATGNHYAYDGVGNMTTDHHKKITIAYNYLNLPAVINFTDGSNKKIEWTYDANGAKLTKVTSTNGVVNATKNYASGIEYAGVNLDAIYFSEGRLIPRGTTFNYTYTIKDHLGNARVSFTDSAGIFLIRQVNHYYPFGLEIEGSWQTQVGPESAYLYNSKELNKDFDLNWYDFKHRFYDAAIGRFMVVDSLSEKFTFLSPYQFCSNSPISNFELDGLEGISLPRLWEEAGFNSTYVAQMVGKVQSAISPDPGTANRLGLLGTGLANMTLGAVGTVGLIDAAGLSGGLSTTMLTLTFGEMSMGFAQTCDACFGTASAEAPLHKAGTIFGAAAYASGNKNAGLVDALTGFIPGLFSGGNIYGPFKLVKDVVTKGSSSLNVKRAAEAVDSYYDVTGVSGAVMEAKSQNQFKSQQPTPIGTRSYFPLKQVGKSDVKFSTKEIDDIRKFIDSQNDKANH